jgi:hypothetical protein
MEEVMAKKSRTSRRNNKVVASTTVVPIDMVRLVGMNAPNWVTEKEYESLQSNWEIQKSSFENPSEFKKAVSKYLKVRISDITLVKNAIRGNWLRFYMSPKVLAQMFKDGLLFSTPDTGQDPKFPTKKNIKIASKHAARQWGRVRNLADWIDGLSINLIKYKNGKIVLQIVDGEHRLWGIIGFQLGLVSLNHPDGCEIYFYSEKIYGEKMNVNGMNLSEIVNNANQMLKNDCDTVTEEDVLEQFNANKIQVTILPMYNRQEASTYFKEKNSHSDDKGIPQMLHAHFDSANIKIRYFSSIKDHLFEGNPSAKLHQFFDECFPEEEKYNLMTFMYAHMVTQFIINDGFVSSSDSEIMERYQKLRGYEGVYTNDLEKKVKVALDFLYNVLIHIKDGYMHMKSGDKPSKQYVQQLLMIRKYLLEKDSYIYDYKLFVEKFDKFVYDNYTDPNTDARLPFGLAMASSGPQYYKNAWEHIRDNFLGKVTKNSVKTPEELMEIGINVRGSKLSRKFSKSRIYSSSRKYNWIDVDGISLKDKGAVPIGGHIISDWELNQLSDSERNIAAEREGCFTNNVFWAHENCRAMSKYHNDRMGVLPLSIYMEVINEPNKVVREREKQFREEVTSRLSKYRTAV